MAAGSNDTQTAIDILKAENERLTGLVSTLTSDRDKHKADLTAAVTERDQLKAQVGNPDEHRLRADKAEQSLRTMVHKAEFSKAAEAAGVPRDMVEDLFTLSGYKAEKDEVDPKAFESLLTEAKTKRPKFFVDAAQQQQGQQQDQQRSGQQQQQQRRQPAGQDRGQAYDPARAGIRVTRAQLADPKFKLDPRNKDIIASALKEGRVDW